MNNFGLFSYFVYNETRHPHFFSVDNIAVLVYPGRGVDSRHNAKAAAGLYYLNRIRLEEEHNTRLARRFNKPQNLLKVKVAIGLQR